MSNPQRLKYVTPSQIPAALYCSICSEVFFDPVRLSCGHVFCKDCITQWSKKRGDCPIDRISLKGLSKLRPETLAQSVLNEFLVYCAYKSRGCGEIIIQESAEDHMKVCNYKKSRKTDDNFVDEDGNVFVEEIITQEDAKTSLWAKLQQKNALNATSILIRG